MIRLSLVLIGSGFGTYISLAGCQWGQATNSCEDSPCSNGYLQGPPVRYRYCVGSTGGYTCCECEEDVRPCVGGGFGYERWYGFDTGYLPCTVVQFSPFQAECSANP